MKTFFSSQSINMFTISEVKTWDFPMHGHYFYELILIDKGNGTHTINDITFDYKAGDVFLLTPSDVHHFDVKKVSTLKYLKFTEQLFAEKLEETPNVKWKSLIQKTIENPNIQPQDIISCEDDRKRLFILYDSLLHEYKRSCMFSRYVLLDIFGAVLSIVARNLAKKSTAVSVKEQYKETEKISQIMSYIRQNISHPEKLSIKTIADEFNLSSNYVSVFVKKHVGLSIQNVIMNTKIKTAERLIEQSELTLSQIAFRLGFTDASHFNKTFKKYNGTNPKNLRVKSHA